MTDEIWEYVLGSGSFPSTSAAPQSKVDVLKREFQYFYPMDIRSSGKDLIPNHLTFCIYVHAALFPEHHWPLSMRANGHLMLNGKKMAKSTGNSLTLRDAIEKFGADATRLSLADAGDGIEVSFASLVLTSFRRADCAFLPSPHVISQDANFEELTANSAIQRLHTQLAWIDVRSISFSRRVCSDSKADFIFRVFFDLFQETMANKAALRTGPADSFWDKAFEQEMYDITERTRNAYELFVPFLSFPSSSLPSPCL